jgi:DNA-binding NarL/FixJ family response regulator
MTKIAIVENKKEIRESLRELVLLDPANRCVCTCETAEEALDLIPKHKPDVVLMDIQLPNLSGIECTVLLKRMMPSVRIIIITTYEDKDRIFKALRAGACGYLLKRYLRSEIIHAIREVRQGGAPMSREIARKVIASFQEPRAIAAEMKNLTRREMEVLKLLTEGFSNKEIAERYSLSGGTVRWHLQHVYRKLHVHTRTEAALKFRSASGQ